MAMCLFERRHFAAFPAIWLVPCSETKALEVGSALNLLFCKTASHNCRTEVLLQTSECESNEFLEGAQGPV
jgi:hypothetical protein